MAAPDYAYFSSISATPAKFELSGGAYGVTVHAGTWGTATLQRQLPDGSTLVTVLSAFSADGYQEIHLPGGIYQLTLSGVSGLVGEVALIASGIY
ncbi:hypothetical protein IC762_12440 [Bradyrhizobium genosp. L]|uniref:hypothetical protein n=1 Tax=Bradyrhizobium genosp. L TaxID=83637 RepID=UPI0018A29CAD|nr:hypothetical protein [Bradyrhizobium genosp. L]QPF87051.1 hypothetical protein IC762_12440 [Bradyrhizobium genosp. L]